MWLANRGNDQDRPATRAAALRPRAGSVHRRGAVARCAGARQQAGGRLLGRLRLPTDRSRRAPGGGITMRAGARDDSLPGATAGRQAL